MPFNEMLDLVVVVPTYNPSSLQLERIVTSLTSQSITAREIIFVDNNSENSVDIKHFAERMGFTYLLCLKPGSYAARNFALRYLQEKLNEHELDRLIICFTDDDCRPNYNWLLEHQKQYAKESNILVAGDVEIEYQPNSFSGCYESMTAFNQKLNVSKGHAVTANLSTPFSLFSQFGWFNENMLSGGDVEFTSRLTAKNIQLRYLPSAKVGHPARSFSEIIRKNRRIAAGAVELRRTKGLAGRFKNYISIVLQPLKLLFASQVDLKIRYRAFFVGVVIQTHKLYLVVFYDLGLLRKKYRD